MKKSILTIAVLSTVSLGALAQTPSFDYVKFGYAQADINDLEIEPSGFQISGSKMLNDKVYVTAGYSDLSDDINILNIKVDFDVNLLNVGLGYKQDLSENSSFFTELNYLDAEIEASSAPVNLDDSDDGYSQGFGVRSMLTEQLELKAEYSYVDFDDSKNVFTLGADYALSDRLSAYVDVTIEDDATPYMIGARLSF